jgi:hypothetical protein
MKFIRMDQIFPTKNGAFEWRRVARITHGLFVKGSEDESAVVLFTCLSALG